MGTKQDLAILYSSLSLPIEEFRKLPAFIKLEQETDMIERLKDYLLPEITRLICASDKLLAYKWAEPYVNFSSYCLCPESFNAVDELLNHQQLEDFENKFLLMRYEPVIQKFNQLFIEEQLQLTTLKQEKTKISKRISKEKKEKSKFDSEGSVEKPLSDDEKKLQKLEKDIFEIERFDKVFKKHKNRINACLEECSQEQENKKRDAAYKSISEKQLTQEEFFLEEFIHSGQLTPEMQEQLKDGVFRSHLLLCLDKGKYSDLAFPVLVKLYEENAIDLEDSEFQCFIVQNKKYLKRYLVSEYEASPDCLENMERGLLFEIAVQIELKGAGGEFSEVWNRFVEESAWIWIKNKMDSLTSNETEHYLYKFAVNLTGKAAQAFVQFLYAENKSLSAMDVIFQLLSQEEIYTKDVIMYALRLQEQALKKTQRRINALERQLNSQEQELFSSIYSPLEQLEELASNLRCTDGSIKCNLVAGQLMNMIGALRDGLMAMGLETIVESDDWKGQRDIEFNAEKHRFTILTENTPEMVKPRTMGFTYRDDDGNEQYHSAKVYTEIRKTESRNPEKSATRKRNQVSSHKTKSERKEKKKPRKGKSYR